MAGRGPAPKTFHHRERDTRRRITSGQVRVVDDGELLGPTLAEATLSDDWSPRTRAWWDTWRRSPQAKAFLATDWQTLALLADLVERYVASPTKDLAAEIRLVHASLGATVTDRQRLRLVVEKPQEATLHALPSTRADVLARLSARDDLEDLLGEPEK
jgi:hypothetical protein